jgi:hypothetical protein
MSTVFGSDCGNIKQEDDSDIYNDNLIDDGIIINKYPDNHGNHDNVICNTDNNENYIDNYGDYGYNNDNSINKNNDNDNDLYKRNKSGKKCHENKENNTTDNVYLDSIKGLRVSPPSSSKKNQNHIFSDRSIDTNSHLIDDSALYTNATTISVEIGKDLKPSLIMTRKKQRTNASRDIKEIILKSAPSMEINICI